jgi:hypothetical protein
MSRTTSTSTPIVSEATPCKGAVQYTVNPAAKEITCKFAALTQGAICPTCPWFKLCEQLNKKSVTVLAFSGMEIGLLPIIKENKTSLTVLTQKGKELTFDKHTKLQTNAKNPKFASRLA